MEIKRVGETKDRGTTILLKDTAISEIRVDSNRNIQLVFDDVASPNQWNTTYRYFVTLSPDDIGQIMSEVYKQALTKNK